MNELKETKTWIAGLQWFFFIFANIIVIPLTIGEAYQLGEIETISIIRLSFIVTGVVCLGQSFFGHKRAILEGQSGLWWGIFLILVTTTATQGITIKELGGSLALGVIISGLFIILIGITGLGPIIAKLFKPAVM